MPWSGSLARMPVPQLASVDGSISATAEARIPVADDGLIYIPLPIPAVAYRKPLVTQGDATALLARLRKIYIFLSIV